MSIYNLQSEKYLKINDIKNISSIKIYDMVNPKNPQVYSGTMGLLVFYEDGNLLNYTQDEEEFVYFFETVRRIYNSEKKSRHIDIDNETEYFLDSLNPSEDINVIKANVGSIGTTNKKIYYKIKEVETHYNILEYVIENLMSFLGRNVDIVGVSGIGSNFALKMYENSFKKNLEFKYINKSELKSICIFKGIIDGIKELYVEINYEDGFQVKFYDYNKSIIGIHRFDKNNCSLVTEIYINGECKSRKYDRLEKSDINSPYLTFEENNYDKYVLPWGDMILQNEKENTSETVLKDRKDIELTENGIKVTNLEDKTLKFLEVRKTFIYVYSNDLHSKVIRQEEVVKSEYSPSLYKLSRVTLKTCEETSITNYYVLNGKYVVKETSFVHSILGSGIYKSELEGKSFYKVYQVLDNKINEEYSIVKEGVQGYQLLDESELRLVLGRGVK